MSNSRYRKSHQNALEIALTPGVQNYEDTASLTTARLITKVTFPPETPILSKLPTKIKKAECSAQIYSMFSLTMGIVDLKDTHTSLMTTIVDTQIYRESYKIPSYVIVSESCTKKTENHTDFTITHYCYCLSIYQKIAISKKLDPTGKNAEVVLRDDAIKDFLIENNFKIVPKED